MGSRGKIIKHLDFTIYIYTKPKRLTFRLRLVRVKTGEKTNFMDVWLERMRG